MGSTYLSFRHHQSHPALPPSSSSLLSSSSPIIKIRLCVNVGVQVPCCRRHHHPSDRELVFATLSSTSSPASSSRYRLSYPSSRGIIRSFPVDARGDFGQKELCSLSCHFVCLT